jgi:hypothetical protein
MALIVAMTRRGEHHLCMQAQLTWMHNTIGADYSRDAVNGIGTCSLS